MQVEVIGLTSYDLRQTSSDKEQILGTVGQTVDNRQFRYAQVGASNVTQGTLLSTPATGANFLGLTVKAAAVVGATQILITLGGTATTTDQFADGSLDIVSSTGAGTSYRIKGNTYQSSTTGVVTVVLAEPLQEAIAKTTNVNLCPNQWLGVTSQVALGSSNDNPRIAGIATTAVTANYYCWVQVEGRAMCINDGAGVIYRGLTVVMSTTTAGEVIQTNASTDADKQVVGNALEHSNATAGLFLPVYLTII